ncbi:MAG TPA: hypothetical protein VFJ99_03135 [Solirubrobacterales bacterium]|nr:hypothetical protein [Solirubrobacterales bacterium]
MTSRHGAPAAVLLILGSLALTACGGGGDEASGSSGGEQSKADFIAQADALCAKARTAATSVKGSGIAAEAKEVTTAYVDLVAGLKALDAPEGDPGFSKFIASAGAMGKKEGEAKAAATKEDVEELGALAGELGPLVEKFEKEAKAYGLKKCG